MDVSQFELIFKPQSPAAPTGTAAVDRVLQGYFLEITNLEDQEYRFLVEFIAPPPQPGTPDAATRTLSGNTLVFVDVPSADNQQGVLTGPPTATVFRPSTGLVRIPAQATALVAVLPSAFGPVPGDPTPLTQPNFEVRGYVRLRLPPVFDFGPPFTIKFKPQSSDPVRVMTTPQNRTTFFAADGTIEDQTQASLPLCSGDACGKVVPEFALFPLSPPFELASLDGPIAGLIEQGTPPNFGEALATLLAAIEASAADLDAFNMALSNSGIDFKVVPA